jgi:hypothetical protein
MMKTKLPSRFRLPAVIAFVATFVGVAASALPETTIPLVFIPVFGVLTLVQYTRRGRRHDERRSGSEPSSW